METKKLSHKQFLERLTTVAEQKLDVSRHARGFKRSIAKALETRDSTIQRWFDKSYPEAEYFIKIYNIFGITPDELLGIEPDTKRPKSLDLHKIQFIAAAYTTDLPKQFLERARWNISHLVLCGVMDASLWNWTTSRATRFAD